MVRDHMSCYPLNLVFHFISMYSGASTIVIFLITRMNALHAHKYFRCNWALSGSPSCCAGHEDTWLHKRGPHLHQQQIARQQLTRVWICYSTTCWDVQLSEALPLVACNRMTVFNLPVGRSHQIWAVSSTTRRHYYPRLSMVVQRSWGNIDFVLTHLVWRCAQIPGRNFRPPRLLQGQRGWIPAEGVEERPVRFSGHPWAITCVLWLRALPSSVPFFGQPEKWTMHVSGLRWWHLRASWCNTSPPGLPHWRIWALTFPCVFEYFLANPVNSN